MSLVLGVDPGQTGGAVLSDGVLVTADGKRIVDFWWSWTKVKTGFRLTRPDGEEVYSSVFAVARAIGRTSTMIGSPIRVVVERGFIGRRDSGKKASDETIMSSLENTGAIIAGLIDGGLPAPSARPTADQWRKMYGWSKLKDDKAEDAAIARAMKEGWLPRVTIKEQGAVAEAACIGLWNG